MSGADGLVEANGCPTCGGDNGEHVAPYRCSSVGVARRQMRPSGTGFTAEDLMTGDGQDVSWTPATVRFVLRNHGFSWSDMTECTDAPRADDAGRFNAGEVLAWLGY